MTQLAQYVLTHGALLLFTLVAVEQAGLPLPSAPVLLSVGSLASSGGMDFGQALVAAVSGSLLADGFWYCVGWSRRSQSRLILASTGGWKDRVLGFVGRHGTRGLLPAKYLFSSNVLSLLAGQRGIPAAQFLAFDGLASVVWSGGYIVLGYILRNQLRWTLAHTFALLAIVVCGALAWLVASALTRGWSNWLRLGSVRAFFEAGPKPRRGSFAVAIALFVLVCPSSFAQQSPQFALGGFTWAADASIAERFSTSGDEKQPSVDTAGLIPASQNQEGGEQDSNNATIIGTVTGIDDAPVSGATVTLEASDSGDERRAETNESGFFKIVGIPPGTPYRLEVKADGFRHWEAPVTLGAGEFKILDVSKLELEEVQTSIVVTPEGSDEIATEQVKAEENQRGFLIVPNFYAVYTPNPEPLSAKLKFSLAFRVFRDPFTLGGVTTLAGFDQAAESPKYGEGAKGYGERFAADYANAFTDIMLDGAVLPAVFHQDPRYFYQGTGSKKSRIFHVFSSLVVAKGDNGHWQPNYSSVGGDLASSAISNLYYPKSNRGPGLVLQGFAIDTAVHVAIRMLDEFVFRPPQVSPDSAPWNSNPHL